MVKVAPPAVATELMPGHDTDPNSMPLDAYIAETMTLLEAGADDVITDDDGAIEVLTPPASFEAVKNALEAAGLKPEVAEVTYRADNTIELEGDDAVKMQKILDALEDLDDVQEVYHNAAL